MPITYTWTATSLIGYPVLDGEADVVTRASYTVLADDGEGHTADYSNFAYTPIDPSVPFIPYADLTNDIIIGWVQFNIGADLVASIEGSLAIQIERQVNPPPQPEVLPLPWVPPVALPPVALPWIPPVALPWVSPVVEVQTVPYQVENQMPIYEPVVVAEDEVIVETSEPTN